MTTPSAENTPPAPDLALVDSSGVEEPVDTEPFKAKLERKVLIQTYDYAVRTLMDMIVEGDIRLDPDYQRLYRWDDMKASRFIESIFLNIPVPVIYMAEEADGKFTVIDGQQRLTSLVRYIRANDVDSMFPERTLGPLSLAGLKIRSDLVGKAYTGLETVDRSALAKRPIRCIVVLNESDSSLKFEVFERLNSGSASLTDQEVRNCIYRGSFNQMLKKLANNPKFQEMVSLPDEARKTMKDAELVLRFFAYRTLDDASNYSDNYKEFLNNYMEENREWPTARIANMERLFNQTVYLIYDSLGTGMAFRKPSDRMNPAHARFAANRINGAIYEAQMIAFSRLVEDGRQRNPKSLKSAALSAFASDEFWGSLFQGTSQKRKVLLRSKVLTQKLRALRK